jgi:hypothetical protein
VLQEAALCVVQSGNETARLEMVKQRFQASGNPIANLLKQAPGSHRAGGRQGPEQFAHHLLSEAG